MHTDFDDYLGNPFLYDKDLEMALNNNDMLHAVMAMRAMAQYKRSIPPPLIKKLCDFLDLDGKPKKTGPKAAFPYYCDPDDDYWIPGKICMDYEFLCQKSNKNVARFVCNNKNKISISDLPISLQDITLWDLGSLKHKVFPSREEIKLCLCELYGVGKRTFEGYKPEEEMDKACDALCREMDDGVPWDQVERWAATFTHKMITLKAKGFSKEEALKIITGKK